MSCGWISVYKEGAGKQHAGIRVFLAASLLSWALLTCAASAAPAPAATTQRDIIAGAKAAYALGQSLNAVIAQALKAASAAGVYVPDMVPGLAETLMQTGIDQKRDGVALSGQIASATYSALAAQDADNATILRTMSQTVEGIRAAADRNKLDTAAVLAQINSSLASVGGTLSTQPSQVVNQAYSQAHAETYTAPGTNGGAGLNGGATAPASPITTLGLSASGGGVFTNTASPSGAH
jgi:hypothetical protein